MIFRSADESGVHVSPSVDWPVESPVAIVALIDRASAEDPDWVRHLHALCRIALELDRHIRVIPVAMEAGVLDDIDIDVQALRWYEWDSQNESRQARLIRELTYEFARLMRFHWQLLSDPGGGQPRLERDLERFQVFLSHTKQDGDGQEIAKAFRSWLHENSSLQSFLDVYDIPAGQTFTEIIDHHIGRSIFLAIYTDQYSNREYCRLEVLEAKRKGVPMIVVDCLRDGDERAFPYLGNVPVVRMNPTNKDRLPQIAGRIIDRILLKYLWLCRLESLPSRPSDTAFVLHPPELAILTTSDARAGKDAVMVYPDPPLGREELKLLGAAMNTLQVSTITQWQSELEL